MTGIEYDICQTQQRIYEYMCRQKYDMGNFSELYLQSEFCRKAMDTNYSRFQLETPQECADFYMPEIGAKLRKLENGPTFDMDIAGWIGFTYRQIYLKTQTSSRLLSWLLPFDVMVQYYPGMHTIDEDTAAQIIIDNTFEKRD